MTTGAGLDEIGRQRVLEILAEQRRRIEQQRVAAIQARSRMGARLGAAEWSGESRAAFTVGAAELIGELDSGIMHLGDALEECDRAVRHVSALPIDTPVVGAGTGANG